MNKPFAQFKENTFGIYRTKISVILAATLVGAILVGTGIALAFLLGPSHENKILTYSGYAILALVVLFFYDIVEVFRNIQGKSSATFLEANALRLTLNPALSPFPAFYEWRHTEEILVVEEFHGSDTKEVPLQNQIVVFFKSGLGLDETLVGNRKAQREVSPQGRLYTLITFPGSFSPDEIAAALKSASNNQAKCLSQKEFRFEAKVLKLAP